jgi:fructokinase
MNSARTDGLRLRIGIDLGGTKIAGVCLTPDDETLAAKRLPTPRNDYAGTIAAIVEMVSELERRSGGRARIGLGMPGSIAPSTGLVQNANSTWLNGRPFAVDLSRQLGRPVRAANDANCFALSEAYDGAAAGEASVFGVILGTGCGGGLVVGGRLINGRRSIGGEWGHNPLPWATAEEMPGPTCWCGLSGCMETWVSGPAVQADHARVTGMDCTSEDIVTRAREGDSDCRATLGRHAGRLARGLASVVNLFDPDVIVLGGGLSERADLYRDLPGLMAPYIFAADRSVDIRPPRWGPASGVRGAARLWGSEPSGDPAPAD